MNALDCEVLSVYLHFAVKCRRADQLLGMVSHEKGLPSVHHHRIYDEIVVIQHPGLLDRGGELDVESVNERFVEIDLEMH